LSHRDGTTCRRSFATATTASRSLFALEPPACSPLGAPADRDAVVAVAKLLRQLVPSRWLNAVYYVAPVWVGIPEAVATVAGLGALLAWLLLELRWRLPPVGLRLPVYRRSRRGGEDAPAGTDGGAGPAESTRSDGDRTD